MMNNKEAKLALNIGLAVRIVNPETDIPLKPIWKEGDRYLSFTRNGEVWDITPFAQHFLNDEFQVFEMTSKEWPQAK